MSESKALPRTGPAKPVAQTPKRQQRYHGKRANQLTVLRRRSRAPICGRPSSANSSAADRAETAAFERPDPIALESLQVCAQVSGAVIAQVASFFECVAVDII